MARKNQLLNGESVRTSIYCHNTVISTGLQCIGLDSIGQAPNKKATIFSGLWTALDYSGL